jgi:hypothetical protein
MRNPVTEKAPSLSQQPCHCYVADSRHDPLRAVDLDVVRRLPTRLLQMAASLSP